MCIYVYACLNVCVCVCVCVCVSVSLPPCVCACVCTGIVSCGNFDNSMFVQAFGTRYVFCVFTPVDLSDESQSI